MDRLVIGTAGGTGAGKTTLSEGLAIYLGSAVVIHEDRYYRDKSQLPTASREDLNYDHPEAIDLDLLTGHLRELVSGRTINQPVYDFVRHVRKKGANTIFSASFIIVEGLFTLFNKLLWDVAKKMHRMRNLVRIPIEVEVTIGDTRQRSRKSRRQL